jgi:hypothetical protein
MVVSADSCAHCGKQGVGFKRCSRCKQACYCGAACQNADWKRHKKKCAPPVTLQNVAVKLDAAEAARDWRGVLQWEGRMEELVARQPDGGCLAASEILKVFSNAHQRGYHVTGSEDHACSFVGLEERRIPLLGKLQRFRDQGDAMCNLADVLYSSSLESNNDAAKWYQRARDVGAAHGFFSLESIACRGLGMAAMEEGRHEEGVELLRNALVAAELNELDDPDYELDTLQSLIFALFQTNSIDEVEPLVLRFREAAKAQSEKEGFCLLEFDSVVCSARLHEVLCLCTPCWQPLLTASSLPAARPSRICHRFIRAREKAHAPVQPCAQPCALCRHAGSLKRPRGRCALCST